LDELLNIDTNLHKLTQYIIAVVEYLSLFRQNTSIL